jgi:hypothetical protein
MADGAGVRPVVNLWEMQQIRNVFAHRRGIADARLGACCGQLPFRVGDLDEEIRPGVRSIRNSVALTRTGLGNSRSLVSAGEALER